MNNIHEQQEAILQEQAQLKEAFDRVQTVIQQGQQQAEQLIRRNLQLEGKLELLKDLGVEQPTETQESVPTETPVTPPQ